MINRIVLISFTLLVFTSCSHVDRFVDYVRGKLDRNVIKSVELQKQDDPPTEILEQKKDEVVLPLTVKPNLTPALQKYCEKISTSFSFWGWGESRCDEFNWNHVRNSVIGDPLLWYVEGDEEEHKKNHKETTMVLCGIHGDEITPIKFCFDILYHVKEHASEFKDKLIVIAPIVNPDSFFKPRPTRTNKRLVDINRNFPTQDWHRDAIRMWKHRFGSDKRRFPGTAPLSEPEVLFQVNLIKRYMPDKIISIHAPLTLLDYDGPEKNNDFEKREDLAKSLLIQMSQKASGYKIKNYPYFPGSLGNWAGNERSIPTYTLELPSSDARKSKEYWKLFKEAIHAAFLHDFRPAPEVAVQEKDNKDKTSKSKE